MAKATNKVTGVNVTADEAVIGRLGPEWEIEKPAPKRKPRGKSDDE